MRDTASAAKLNRFNDILGGGLRGVNGLRVFERRPGEGRLTRFYRRRRLGLYGIGLRHRLKGVLFLLRRGRLGSCWLTSGGLSIALWSGGRLREQANSSSIQNEKKPKCNEVREKCAQARMPGELHQKLGPFLSAPLNRRSRYKIRFIQFGDFSKLSVGVSGESDEDPINLTRQCTKK